MLHTPLVLALCCAITITTANPLTEENITKANLKQPKTDTVKQYVKILEKQIDVKLNTVKTELEENLKRQENSIKTLINNLATQISNDVNKLLAELEVKCADQLNTKQNGSVGDQLTESSTSEASVLNSTTDRVDISESNNAGTNVPTKQKTDGPSSEVEDDWWDTICNDPADDAQTLQNKNEKNIKLDEYDTRLQNITGCDTRIMTSYSGVGWPALSKRRPELWMAVRVLKANGFARIYVDLDDVSIFYFAVNSMGDTMARNTDLIEDELSRLQQATNITPQEHREHYIPMYMKLEKDVLQWRVGCGNRVYKGVEHLTISRLTNIGVRVEAREYAFKTLYDCPPQASRQHKNIQGLPDCRHSFKMKQLDECMRESQINLDKSLSGQKCQSVAKAKKCYLELSTMIKTCDDDFILIDRIDSYIKAQFDPVLQAEKCSSIVD